MHCVTNTAKKKEIEHLDLGVIVLSHFSQPSIAINKEFKALSVSPNPFSNTFEYEYGVEKDEPVTVNLFALNGRIVKTLKNAENHHTGNYSDAVVASNLDTGVYILLVTTSESDKTRKLIKN